MRKTHEKPWIKLGYCYEISYFHSFKTSSVYTWEQAPRPCIYMYGQWVGTVVLVLTIMKMRVYTHMRVLQDAGLLSNRCTTIAGGAMFWAS